MNITRRIELINLFDNMQGYDHKDKHGISSKRYLVHYNLFLRSQGHKRELKRLERHPEEALRFAEWLLGQQ